VTDLKRLRRLNIGPFPIEVALRDTTARQIGRSAIYRRVLRPSFGFVTRRGRNGPADVSAPPPEPVTSGLGPEAEAILEKISPLMWYHRIDLGHGVFTPGWSYHQLHVPHYQLPPSLAGLRCLDVGTMDGFWAFEMERRGAAEVVATDLADWADWDVVPSELEAMRHLTDNGQGPVDGFRVAHEILESRVRLEVCSVYELSAERLGKFDLIMVGDVLAHVRDPALALERVFDVARGRLLLAEVYSPTLERYGDRCLSEFKAGGKTQPWWVPSVATLKAMMYSAGFDGIDELSRFQWSCFGLDPEGHVVVNQSTKVVLSGYVPEAPPVAARVPVQARSGLGRTLRLGPVEFRISRTSSQPAAPSRLPATRARLGSLATVPDGAGAGTRKLLEQVNRIRWDQSIDLGGGVVTPGFGDLRGQVNNYGLPGSLAGLRCLDVAARDGFWAFEMERRGAGEVVALDIDRLGDCDIPRRLKRGIGAGDLRGQSAAGFDLARMALGSQVHRESCSIYELSPRQFGEFDFIVVSDLLRYLRNPELALERIRSVCRAEAVVADAFDATLEHLEGCFTSFTPIEPGEAIVWWLPSTATLARMMQVAGFARVDEVSRFVLAVEPQWLRHRVVLAGRVDRAGRLAAGERSRSGNSSTALPSDPHPALHMSRDWSGHPHA
jgi:tRNA (mo5U34)-methyltransferase